MKQMGRELGDLDVDRAAMRVKVLAALIRRLRAGATHREPTGAFEFHVGVECDFARRSQTVLRLEIQTIFAGAIAEV